MILTDTHMHTSFSFDSEASPESMIEGAIEKGLYAVTFTDHYDKDNMDWGYEDIFDPEAYFQKLLPLKERYKEKIDIRIGVELGIQPYLAEYFCEFVKKYPFDYVIGSTHSVEKHDICFGIPFEGRTDDELYRIMFEETMESLRLYEDQFDVLGHMDYSTRYGKEKGFLYSYQRYADYIDEILKLMIEKGKGLELNTSGWKYGLPYAHPHPDILKRYRELGGDMVTLGADAHQPGHIAYDFEKGTELLLSCGFRYYTEFIGRKPFRSKIE